MAGTFSLLCAFAIVVISSGEVIQTRLGELEGLTRKSRDGRDYTAWTKVPYGKPPIGSLRLANPEPFGSWTGVLNATEPFPYCIQFTGVGFVGEEDCLYVSIYKPNIEDKLLPVLFTIHGGGFVGGYPGPDNLADYLMDESVILVSVTYRLGVLGFMSLNDTVLPGNFGLKDQALALKWVYENIEDYGGDPKRITVFGGSAGGASTQYMLLSPLTRDMVFAAHAVSGTVNKIWSIQDQESMKKASETVAGSINCARETSEEVLKCLRAIESPNVIQQGLAAVGATSDVDVILFGPTIEPSGPGAIASEDLSLATSTKPLILSHTAGEFSLATTTDQLSGGGRALRIKNDIDAYSRNYLRRFLPDENKLKCAAKRLRERYLYNETLPGLLQGSGMILQDLGFVYPATEWAKKHQGPKWIYQMVHRGELTSVGIPTYPQNVAAHSDDIVYLLNNRKMIPSLSPQMNPTDERVSRILVAHLVNLATYGNPTPDGSWEQFRENEIYRMLTEGFVKGDGDFIKEQFDIDNFWNEIIVDGK